MRCEGRVGQPAVLGELLGIALGPSLLGFIYKLLQVGPLATRVALLGIILPLAFGMGALLAQ